MRVFVALDLPDDVADGLDSLAGRLHTGRHVPSDDMHLTLAFIEDAPPDALEELHMRLEMLTRPLPQLTLRGVDVFGSEHPRSVHVRVEGGVALSDLQSAVTRHVRRAGIALPRRRFVPHVTLARFAARMAPDDTARVGRFLSAHGDWTWPAFTAPSLSLYQSTLSVDGPRYDLLERYGALEL